MIRELESGNKVCMLSKALYRLRQAGRCWNEKLCKVLKILGMNKSSVDPCLFFKGHGDELILLAIYVDDLLITSQNEKEFTRIKELLSKHFEIKDLSPVKYCLGIEFNQSNGTICMKQEGYIRDILERFGISGANAATSPLDPNIKLEVCSEETHESRSFPYRELIGSLMYVTVCTRLDIAHAVGRLSQFNDRHGSMHWTAAKRVLRYLKGTSNLSLVYKKIGRSNLGYVDANWANLSTIDYRQKVVYRLRVYFGRMPNIL